MFNHKEQKGFLTLAYNSGDTNYVDLAYLQALSIKTVMPTAKFAVVTNSKITEKQKKVFDYVIECRETMWPMEVEPELFWLTPFKETIKLESDLLINRNIEHWWHALRLRNIVLSNNCRNIQDEIIIDSEYRKFWRDNELPNIYNGMMYFRYSQEATRFFYLAQQLFRNYDYLRDNVLKNCREEKPSTDVIYSLAAKIIGVEHCTIPSLDFFNFVHMKPHIQNWPGQVDWNELALAEVAPPILRINNLNQYHPVHYHVKHWPKDTVINRYEHASGIN
jgi:hypothetical protein